MKNHKNLKKILDYLIEQLNTHQDLIINTTDGKDFENEILNRLSLMSETKKPIEFKVYHNGPHSFPDISLTFLENECERKFGLEVKFSGSGNWKSKGNSVFESISDTSGIDFEEIYIIYGRKPKSSEQSQRIDLMYKPYFESIEKIEVTHSPRFAINMKLDPDENLFKIIDVEENYQKFRKRSTSDKNDFLRKYFSKITSEKDKDKWYLPTISYDYAEEISLPPLLLNDLSKEVKQTLISECIILFLHELIKSKTNYKQIASYLIEKHFVYTTSLRDFFTSGGVEDIFKDGVQYSQIYHKIFLSTITINSILNDHDHDFETSFRNSWSEYFAIQKQTELFSISTNPAYDVKQLFHIYVKHFKLEKLIVIN